MTRPGLVFAIAAACQIAGCSGTAGGPAINNKVTPEPAAAPAESTVISAEIFAREPLANTAMVKHILISWRDLGEQFGGQLDPRAKGRSKADAETAVRKLLKQLAEGADFDTVMKAESEDLGSAMSGRTFTVTPDAQLVIEFRQLSLRLRPGEVGVCQSDFGFHIIKRIS
jgi:PPIC-type PPIASE domain